MEFTLYKPTVPASRYNVKVTLIPNNGTEMATSFLCKFFVNKTCRYYHSFKKFTYTFFVSQLVPQ